MNILLLNSILRTAQNNKIPQTQSIKDCMIYNLALAFKTLGHNITLIAASEYRPTITEEYEINVIYIKSAWKKIFLPSVLPFQLKLWHYLKKKEKEFDLIISSEVFAFPSLFAAIIAPEKTVIWHELALHQKKMREIPSRFWYNVVARLFFRKTLIVTRSENAKDFIKKYLPKVANETVEHGINLQKFNFSREKKRQFIVVSQLIPRKNIECILEKFARFVAQKDCSDFQLIIVGKGELEDKLKKQSIDLQIDKNAVFAGFKTHLELNVLLAQSMAMLVDTKQDLNMVSIPESIVCGTPVVTNCVPYTSRMIRENALGIARKDWNESDLREIVKNNVVYVENCIAYRSKLTNIYSAQELINIYSKKL